MAGSTSEQQVTGLVAQVTVRGADSPPIDRTLGTTGAGDDVVNDGLVASKRWLAVNARTIDGDTVIDLGGRRRLTVPGVTLESLLQQ